MAKWDGRYSWDVPPSSVGAPARLKVATCQIPVSHDIRRNCEAIVSLIGLAADAGADVAHFPECAVTGYGPENWPDWSQFSWRDADEANALVRAAARKRGLWVVAGSAHRETPTRKPYNSLYVINRQGELAGRYDKRGCSHNDRTAFEVGTSALTVAIDGVPCGFLICLDWSFPELWQAYAGQVELVFHSAASDAASREKVESHAIPALMQSYAWLHQYAVSLSNSCRPRQNVASMWIERSGHPGPSAVSGETGYILNAVADDPEQDRFFAMVRNFRDALRS